MALWGWLLLLWLSPAALFAILLPILLIKPSKEKPTEAGRKPEADEPTARPDTSAPAAHS
jgi:hypothetical protein